ncbi:hypothetical protein [Sporosarcina sp. P1]|uniref:hypothetical protein n=1 Tax=Sporosarcina sp. P1 TaxID=2048257 RepID=UPI0018EDD56E|nr:hypothetical protein [Sporosarcina sp. P1]
MKLKYICFFLVVLSALLIMGCANKLNSEKVNNVYEYSDVRAAAWVFVNEKGWNNTAEDGWQGADVEETMADNRYVLLDKKYEGQEVLVVTFEDVENVVTGTPQILVDSTTNEVIGYMPTEYVINSHKTIHFNIEFVERGIAYEDCIGVADGFNNREELEKNRSKITKKN